MTSPKALAKLLKSLGSVTINGATVFSGQHCHKANYILFLLSIAYVDTCKVLEIAKVSRCACLFALGVIISHLKLIGVLKFADQGTSDNSEECVTVCHYYNYQAPDL